MSQRYEADDMKVSHKKNPKNCVKIMFSRILNKSNYTDTHLLQWKVKQWSISRINY